MAETNASVVTLTIDPSLANYKDSADLQLILFNANGQVDYWDSTPPGSEVYAVPEFFYLSPTVDFNDPFEV